MKNKKTVIAIVALVLVIAVFVGVWAATRPETAAGGKTITVTVVHGDGTSKVFTISTDEEYLAPALKAEGILLETEGSDGMYNTVDGEKADYSVNQSYWGVYVGSEYAMEGMNDIVIQDGDTFKLEYTVYNG